MSWHGYIDLILTERQANGRHKPIVVEIKTKVGRGAEFTLKEKPYSAFTEYNIKCPDPDTEWGQAQQLALYLRDIFRKTVDHPSFSEPIRDGMLLQLLHCNDFSTFVEYWFEYQPESDSAVCYYTKCHDYPQASGEKNIVVKLSDVADRWKIANDAINRKELAEPTYQRKYALDDPRIEKSTKSKVKAAALNRGVLGDIQCSYCAFKDRCAQDLKIDLTYSPEEVQQLKQLYD